MCKNDVFYQDRLGTNIGKTQKNPFLRKPFTHTERETDRHAPALLWAQAGGFHCGGSLACHGKFVNSRPTESGKAERLWRMYRWSVITPSGFGPAPARPAIGPQRPLWQLRQPVLIPKHRRQNTDDDFLSKFAATPPASACLGKISTCSGLPRCRLISAGWHRWYRYRVVYRPFLASNVGGTAAPSLPTEEKHEIV
jgi:hypothetical protein